MFKQIIKNRAQSALEYTLLIIVLATALTAMSTYIQRSINARLRQVQLEMNESRR